MRLPWWETASTGSASMAARSRPGSAVAIPSLTSATCSARERPSLRERLMRTGRADRPNQAADTSMATRTPIPLPAAKETRGLGPTRAT